MKKLIPCLLFTSYTPTISYHFLYFCHLGSMMERTSFGMQKFSDLSPSSQPLSPEEAKPALPKRSPAPKQENNVSSMSKEGEKDKHLSEERIGSSNTSMVAENSVQNKPAKCMYFLIITVMNPIFY